MQQQEPNRYQYEQHLQKEEAPEYVAESSTAAFPKQSRISPRLSADDPTMLKIIGLFGLKKGWLDGKDGGAALPKEGLNRFANMAAKHFSRVSARPRIFPTAEGGILLGWKAGTRQASLEVDLTTLKGEWMVFNTDPGGDAVLDLSADAGWQRLIALVSSLNT